MTAKLTEAYYRRLRSFDQGDVEEFYSPTQARDKEGQWTKMWSGVSAHPDHRSAPVAKDITILRLQQSPEHLSRQIYDADLGNGFESVIDDDGVDYSFGAAYINGKILNKAGQQVGYFKRQLFQDDDGKLVAEHQELFLDPQYQGRGLADRFNAHAISKYQKYGVDRIELEAAADVGGFAWARQGFRFKGSDEERKDFLTRQLDRTSVKFNIPLLREHKAQLDADVAVLRKAIQAGEDVQPIHIASIGETYARYTSRDLQAGLREYETWPGKELLLNTQWNGVYYFDTNAAVTAAASSLAHAELRPAFRAETPVLVQYLEAQLCEHGEFACRDASCRPPTSGGTGGSKPGKNPLSVSFHSGVSKDQYKAAGELKHLGSLTVAANMTDSERETIRAELDHEVVDQEAWATEPFSQAVYMAKANMGGMEGMTVGMAVQLDAVYSRFEDDYPVMDKVQALMSDYNGDRQAFSAAVQEITGVSVESGFVNYINSRWANSSVQTESLAMQLTVASVHELRGGLDSIRAYVGSDYEGAVKIIEKAGGALKAVAKATYRTTQEALEDQGITEVELFRGIKSKAAAQADKIIAQPNPLSSWTTDKNISYLFSGNGGAYVSRIPASQIYSLSNLSGTGALKESEVIVLGQRVTATRLKSSEELAATELPVVLIDHDDPDWIKTPKVVRAAAQHIEEFKFDPRQARDKDGKWTVSVQHVASKANAESILRGGFSTDTPTWDRSFGDGVYLSEKGDEKSAKFYARQGDGREWRTAQVVEGTVSLSNPLHIEAREHSNFRAEVVKVLGGTEAVRQMAQARYDHTVAVTKRIVAEEAGADHGIPLDHPEKVNWYHVEGAEKFPDNIWVSPKVEALSERIHQRIKEETGGNPQENASWYWLAKNVEKIAKPGVVTSSDSDTHYSRLLGNLARDAGHDGIVINTNSWGGVGGQQIVVFDPSTIKVTGSRPYANRAVTAAAQLCEHGNFACHSAACRPPTSGGTGGSRPGGGGSHKVLPNGADPEKRYVERLRAIGIRDPDNIGPEYDDAGDSKRADHFRAMVPKDLDGAVRSRIEPSQLESILKVGMLTQHDTGFSAGMFNPEAREGHEGRMFSEKDTHPIYGYIHTVDTLGSRLDQYGGISVVFKNEVNTRTTVTYGDSLDYANPPAPVHLTDVHRSSDMRLTHAATEGSNSRPGYIEAQIHGQIRPEHIAKLVVDRTRISYGDDHRWDLVVGLAKQRGIEVEEVTDNREYTAYGQTYDVLHFEANSMKIIARRGETEAWADEDFDPATGSVTLRSPGQPDTVERWQVALKFGGWEPSNRAIAAALKIK